MSVLRAPCGSLDCQGRVLTVDELCDESFLVGRCERCGTEWSLPVSRANPQVRRERLLEKAGLPRLFASRRFEEDDTNRAVLEGLRSWLAAINPDDLATALPAPALWGEAGRGKTHALVALCRRLIGDKGVSVAWFSARSLLRELQDFDGDAKRTWDRAVSVDVLALDDLGAQQDTAWRLDQLADLIDERYQRERPVLVATNFPPSTWPDVLDARTASRLRGMTWPLELRGPDRRQQTIPTTEGVRA